MYGLFWFWFWIKTDNTAYQALVLVWLWCGNRIYRIGFTCKYDVSWYPFDIQNCFMDLKSPGRQGVYVDIVKDKLKYLGRQEMSSYYLRDVTYTQKRVEKENLFNTGSYEQCKITLGRRLLSVMTTVYLPTTGV